MITINSIAGNKFELNGIQYFMNFTPVVKGDKVMIVNTYDAKTVLVQLTDYTEFTVDNSTYGSVSALQSALLPVIFTRSNLPSGGTGVWGSITGDITNQTDLVDYVANNGGGGGTQDLEDVINEDPVATSKPEFNGGIQVGDGNDAVIDLEDGENCSIMADGGLNIAHSVNIEITSPSVTKNSKEINSFGRAYNASTNSPTLSNTDTNVEGIEYEVTVAGSQDFGAGSITFGVGDIIHNNGTIWRKKVDNNQSGTQNLQEVTDEGATTTNDIEIQAELTVGTTDEGNISINAGDSDASISADENSMTIEHTKKVTVAHGGKTGDVNALAGTWNASTNTPTLSNSDTDVQGFEYEVTVAGSQDFGAGSIIFGVGDIVSNNGTIWRKKVDNNQSSGGGTMATTSYDNSDSSLSATNGKAAIDELYSKKVNLTGDSDDILLGDGSTTSLSALDPNANPIPAGQVYVNNFETLTGLTLETTNGTVTLETPIGSTLPNVTYALTVESTSPGNTYAAVDLGQTYDELYVQYYTSVIDKSTATSYTDNLKVGAGANASDNCKMFMSHVLSWFRPYGFPGYQDLGRYLREGVWSKIGMHIDRVAQTVDYYIDGRFIGQQSTNNQDLQFITLGGSADNVAGYKVQYASLTVNEVGFQDAITNANGVGTYQTQYVDYSLASNTDYNGVDITALDTSDWSGLHSEPFDKDGGTAYTDGPKFYLNDAGNSNIYAKKYDKFALKRGVAHKMENMTDASKINLGTGGYSATTFNTLSSYGTGDMPILDLGVRVDSADWTVYDAPDNIYRIAITGATNCNGVWINETEGLRQVTVLGNLNNHVGSWYKDSTHVYVRLYDESDPSLSDVDLGSAQGFSITEYGQVNNVHFRYSSVLAGDNCIIEDFKMSLGAGADVSDWILRDGTISSLWGGQDYYLSEANVPGNGLGSSGIGVGIQMFEDSKVYRVKAEDAYLAIEILPDAHDALLAFCELKNTIVNTVTISGSGTGLANRPIRIYNNTILASPRALDDDPYPLSRDQPGHGFVIQAGGTPFIEFLNNVGCLHYATINTQPGVMNIISIVNTNASGKIDYNRYFISANSTSPAEIFNLGTGNDLSSWSTALMAYGTTDWTGINDDAVVDENSEVVSISPVVQSSASATSGKWVTTIGTPKQLGGGYPIDYASLGITTNLSGETISTYRNIGAY